MWVKGHIAEKRTMIWKWCWHALPLFFMKMEASNVYPIWTHWYHFRWKAELIKIPTTEEVNCNSICNHGGYNIVRHYDWRKKSIFKWPLGLHLELWWHVYFLSESLTCSNNFNMVKKVEVYILLSPIEVSKEILPILTEVVKLINSSFWWLFILF